MEKTINPTEFSQPDGIQSLVTLNGRPMGSIQRYGNVTWTYDHKGVSFVGKYQDVKHAVSNYYKGRGPKP